MARVGPAAVRGYLLEEALAFLVKKSGYSLLVSPRQDPSSLEERGNGLVVRGRGAVHQVDVLGELDWIPAFTFPLRLFLEAKFQRTKTGIQTVRNAVGVLVDLNQQYGQTARGSPIRRYRYAYALFSVSGFSGPAVEMAFAHEISLVDLGGREYQSLTSAIRSASEEVSQMFRTGPSTSDDRLDAEEEDASGIVATLRSTARAMLGTDPEVDGGSLTLDSAVSRILSPVESATREIGELFVGMAAGPYMLLLSCDNRDRFLTRMTQRPVLEVTIHYTKSVDAGWTWLIKPANRELGFELSFRLPDAIGNWIFGEEGGSSARARRFKKQLLPHIFVPYRDAEGINHLYRLDYSEVMEDASPG
jgi:hypothetical protein